MHIVVTGYGPFCSKAEDKDRATQFDINPSWAGLQIVCFFHRFMFWRGNYFMMSPTLGSSEALTNDMGSRGC